MNDSAVVKFELTASGKLLRICQRCLMVVDEFGFPDPTWYPTGTYRHLLQTSLKDKCEHKKPATSGRVNAPVKTAKATPGESMSGEQDFIPTLSSLLSETTRNSLKRNGDYISFGNGWLANRNGKLVIVLNLPSSLPSMYNDVTFGNLHLLPETKAVYQTTDPTATIPPHCGVNKEVVMKLDPSKLYPYKAYDDQSKFDKLVACCDNPEMLLKCLNGAHFRVTPSGWVSYKINSEAFDLSTSKAESQVSSRKEVYSALTQEDSYAQGWTVGGLRKADAYTNARTGQPFSLVEWITFAEKYLNEAKLGWANYVKDENTIRIRLLKAASCLISGLTTSATPEDLRKIAGVSSTRFPINTQGLKDLDPKDYSKREDGGDQS